MKKVCFVSGSVYVLVDEETRYLIESLKKRDISSRVENWDDPDVNWSQYSLCINRTTSNYMRHPTEYIEWAKRVEKETQLWNSAKILEWNHHKGYLLELQDSGIKTPPTVLTRRTAQTPLNEITPVNWKDIVIKPAITAGSFGLKKLKPRSEEATQHYDNILNQGYIQVAPDGTPYECPACDVIIQEYLSEITEKGEASLIYFDGKYSHAIIKKPAKDDFRAHPMWNASMGIHKATPTEIEFGYSILDIVPDNTHYARIDMIPGKQPTVIEVELIEPMLFFNFFPQTVELFAKHIATHIKM
jgi:glutathione synthase/RimK-type ligase-like ATP-grasp enzyme